MWRIALLLGVFLVALVGYPVSAQVCDPEPCTETPTPTPSATPTITPTPTVTPTPTPDVWSYMTLQPPEATDEAGEPVGGQPVLVKYELDAGQVLTNVLLFGLFVLKLIEMLLSLFKRG